MNLLLTGAFAYTKDQLRMLAETGCEISFVQHEADALPLPASKIEATVCNGLFLHHPIESFTNLSFIQLTSAGLDRVPLAAIRERGIALHNARGVYGIPMAEWAVFRVLEHFKQGEHFARAQQEHRWSKHRGLREIFGSEIAVVGAGNVGQEVASRFRCFGARITGFDIRTDSVPGFDDIRHVEELSASVQRFDVVVLTAPLTEQTRHLFDGQMLGRMKQHAMLVNISRGGLVDEAAMCRVLLERPDLHAALDVFEEEPLPETSPLWRLPNVAVSPHNSFVSDGNAERMFALMLRNLTEYVKGKR